MNLISKRVKHTTFGEGVITNLQDNHIHVKFPAYEEDKVFNYPLCFQTFLSLLDTDAVCVIEAALTEAVLKEREREERERQEEAARDELLRLRYQDKKKTASRVNKSIDLRPFASADEFCEVFKKELIAEIAFLKESGGKRQRLVEGTLVEHGRGYIYSFEAETELYYPNGTQITLWLGAQEYAARIVECVEFSVIVAASERLAGSLDSVEFSAEPWRLINSLIERMEELILSPSGIVQSLICDGYKQIRHGEEIAKEQDNACRYALVKPVTFIWGPPGTGKTQTLARIALQHIAKNRRVLMLSYSNVSVDGAILRVDKLDEHKRAGKLVRYGYPRDKGLLENKYLTSYNLAIHRHPELLRERTSLIEERKKLSGTSRRYVEIGKRLSAIRKQLKDEEAAAVRAAKFVATTVSKAVVDKEIYEGDFDVVIFDEASMAYIPQIVFAASLASAHFVCIGDFNQLPPIVQHSSTSILSADIFQYCGITSAVEKGCGHDWLCMLDEQFRMHPSIADFASKGMYHELLSSDEGMQEKRAAIVASQPLEGQAFGLADLSGMMSTCIRTSGLSRINPLSAFISFGLALKAAESHEVSIITPYNAQSRLLMAMSRDIAEKRNELRAISCATVHQFQGSEKDVIIYDAVDCYRQRYPGMLLTSFTNNSANRLFNVALTRAKGKFIAVTNADYMKNKNLSKNLLFSKLISHCHNTEQYMNGKRLNNDLSSDNRSCFMWPKQNIRIIDYLRDIANAEHEIRIDIPGAIAGNELYIRKLSEALDNARDGGVHVLIRAESKRNSPEELLKFAIENRFVANPITIIDRAVAWFGMPHSAAEFITEAGALKTLYRPVFRIEGKRTASALNGFLEMNNTVDQISMSGDEDTLLSGMTFAMYVTGNVSCEKCGKPMKLIKRKNRSGFFLGCSGYPDCDSPQDVPAWLVDEYLESFNECEKLCPQDQSPLEVVNGKYEVIVQCCGQEHHRFRLDEI